MNEQELKAACTHRAVANFPVGGMSEGWRDRWLCDACRTEFVPLVQVSAQLKEAREALHHLREVGASLCCALDADGAMNTEAFARLCDLAMYCGCTHLGWWTKDAEPDGCKGRCSTGLEVAAHPEAAECVTNPTTRSWYGFWVESKPPRCMDCGGDGKTVEAEPTGREGGVKGGIEPCSPLPLADVPPSTCGKECDHGSPCIQAANHAPADRHETEHGCVFFDPRRSVFGTDAVCMPPVSAEVMEIVKWLRVTPVARGVLLGIGSSQDIARLADAIERGEYRVSRDHK